MNIAYPADDSTAGSDGNPLRMTGDQITLTFWRPQRAGLGTEPAFMDMGHLRYGIPISVGNREVGCGAQRFSGLSSTLSTPPGLGAATSSTSSSRCRTRRTTRAPNAANTLKLTFDIGGCLRAAGIDPTGQQVRLPVEAVTESRPGGTDRTAQTLAVCLPGCIPAQ